MKSVIHLVTLELCNLDVSVTVFRVLFSLVISFVLIFDTPINFQPNHRVGGMSQTSIDYTSIGSRPHGPLTRWVKLLFVHAPGMPGTFSPVSDPGMHHGTCVTHVPWCMPRSLSHGSGESVPGIPGVCATRNSTYLVRGPCSQASATR